MTDVSGFRLYLLRAMYLLIAVGLAVEVWPHIISPPDLVAGPKSVMLALLGALALTSQPSSLIRPRLDGPHE